MRTLAFMILAIFSSASFAEPIITDPVKVESLYEKFQQNPFYLKAGLGKIKIHYFEVGKAQTPFYNVTQRLNAFTKMIPPVLS